MRIFSNLIGAFVFNEKFDVVDKILFSALEDYKNKGKFLRELENRHKDIKIPDGSDLKKILLHFKNKRFFHDFCVKNLEMTKFDLKNSIGTDILIIQAINSIDDLEKVINLLAKRLREWYELYNPEFSKSIKNHERFTEEILEKEKYELLEQIKIKIEDSFGADLAQEDIEPIRSMAHQIFDLFQLKKNLIEYISSSMDDLCPNVKSVCGPVIGAKLIEHAGSLKRLSEMPSSTIQILGAEQALFRHLKTGSKPPRHGIIVNHELIAKSDDKLHGKIARAIADKISIAAKVDYFHGQFIGDKLRKGLEEKFLKK